MNYVKMVNTKLQPQLMSIYRHYINRGKDIFDENLKVLDSDNFLAFNYFALGIRELINTMLNNKLTIDYIKTTSWYKKYDYKTDEDDNEIVSTKQKLAFRICGWADVDSINEIVNIKDSINNLYKQYRELNKYAHLNVILPELEWETKIIEVITKFADFLEQIDNKEEKVEEILNELEERIHKYFLENPIPELSEILSKSETKTTIYQMIIKDHQKVKGSNEINFDITISAGIKDKDYDFEEGSIIDFPFNMEIKLRCMINNTKVPSIVDIEMLNFIPYNYDKNN